MSKQTPKQEFDARNPHHMQAWIHAKHTQNAEHLNNFMDTTIVPHRVAGMQMAGHVASMAFNGPPAAQKKQK